MLHFTRIVFKLGAVLIALSSASPARAEASARELLTKYENASERDKQLFETVIDANENGMAWAQTFMKGEKLYCAPPNLVMDRRQTMSILRQGVRAMPSIADKPYGLALLLSLQHIFPCSK